MYQVYGIELHNGAWHHVCFGLHGQIQLESSSRPVRNASPFVVCLAWPAGLVIRQNPNGEVFLSKLTLAALEDIGYIVDPSKVNQYACGFLATDTVPRRLACRGKLQYGVVNSTAVSGVVNSSLPIRPGWGKAVKHVPSDRVLSVRSTSYRTTTLFSCR